ncbi:hypothetical protein ABES02_15970 [Neobacillus pocheonensis]|uniref:hypothetical protein n=1 Tax=Neobacillus pocheonensis TaxID=363869 RepID=UPI003D2B71FE
MKSLRKQPFFNLFMPKRKSRGALWASLVGLGLSAAVFGVTKGKRKDFALPIQNAVKSMAPNFNNINRMDTAALTEFSEELLESALNNKR